VLPVSDVDRAKTFYQGLGWRLDADFVTGPDFRVVQMTPPGSACAVIFGTGITSAAPGSTEGLQLVVTDIDAARAELAACGDEVTEVFHDSGGVFHHADSVAGLADALRRAEAAHGKYEEETGQPDPNWPDWYAQYLVNEREGQVKGEGKVGGT